MGLVLTAISVAATGGAESPARFYLLFVVFYASYFYPPREAIPHLIGCIAVLMLPLAYDPNAVDAGLLAETLVLAPAFIVLGVLIMGGKHVMLVLSRNDPLTGLVNRRASSTAARQLGRRARLRALRADALRPRLLQVGERPPRPPGGRPRAARDRRRAAGDGASRRRRRPGRRRRVRRRRRRGRRPHDERARRPPARRAAAGGGGPRPAATTRSRPASAGPSTRRDADSGQRTSSPSPTTRCAARSAPTGPLAARGRRSRSRAPRRAGWRVGPYKAPSASAVSAVSVSA